MGSGFSCYIDRSQCHKKHDLEGWTNYAVAAAACRASTYTLAGAVPGKVRRVRVFALAA